VSYGYALMSAKTFGRLSEDSMTLPSSVYAGKMWRRRELLAREGEVERPRWILCWYGQSDEKGSTPVQSREIVIT
jgi:hypothetical protein